MSLGLKAVIMVVVISLPLILTVFRAPRTSGPPPAQRFTVALLVFLAMGYWISTLMLSLWILALLEGKPPQGGFTMLVAPLLLSAFTFGSFSLLAYRKFVKRKA